MPAWQTVPAQHPVHAFPEHSLPQPSDAPRHLPAQLGVQQLPWVQNMGAVQLVQLPPCFPQKESELAWQTPPAQQPVQVLVGHCPPQPSDCPAHFSVQFGVQHCPWLQTAGLLQAWHVAPEIPQNALVLEWQTLLASQHPAHWPAQMPPHSSEAPAHLPAHFGVQHAPLWQTAGLLQAVQAPPAVPQKSLSLAWQTKLPSQQPPH